jgi:acyl-CoA reductase-like NAD-dependent aldehyde dehydrogenase
MTERIVRSPYDGREAGRVAVPSGADVAAAVARASKIFETTRKLPTYRRAAILRAIADGILGKKEALARTIALEAGKPLKAAWTEVDRAAGTFSAAAAAVETASDTHFPLDMNPASPGKWGILRRFPLGPVAAITPFNFPLNLTSHKVAPAIGVGAPVVQKPASQTPLSAVALREIVLSAGWPEEAYAVLCVSGAGGEALVTDPRLPVVSFTGSAAVGWRLREMAPRKRVGLELGGNAGLVVHEDADLVDAATRAASGGFVYAGQSCISVQRILVHRPVQAAFRDLLLSATAKMKTGDPLDESVDVGPMISEADAVRAESWIHEAVAGGAELLAGGKRSGSVLPPTVLARTVPSMKVECDEVFAPVVTLTPYDTFEEALARVNDSRYGLQAGVFTRDLGRIEQAFETLEVGGIIVNDAPTWRADRMPYGGVKDSGVGREGPLYAMEEFTDPRLLVLRAP